MIQDFTPLPRSCEKCNYEGPKTDSDHKEYCRLFQDAVKKLRWFPRNAATRKRDLDEAILNISNCEEDDYIEKAIFFMVIIGCEYDSLIERAIETGNPQCVPDITSFSINFADRQLALGKINTKYYCKILDRLSYGYDT